MRMVPIPPSTTAGTAPTSAAEPPARNAPTSFEALRKTAFTALTRPRRWSGVQSCTTVARIYTLMTSLAPMTTSAATEIQSTVDMPKTMVERPNIATVTKSTSPAWSRSGIEGQVEADDNAADARRGAQQPKTPRTDRQDVARIDRHERHGSAEQHGEEVERDRAEHDLFLPDVAEAGDELGPAGRPRRDPLAGRRNHRDEPDTQHRNEQRDAVCRSRRDLVEQAAGKRPGDGGGARDRRDEGEGVADGIRRHEIRDDRLLHRIDEAARRAEDHEREKDGPDHLDVDPGKDQEQPGAERVHDKRQRHDEAAVVAVGDGAGGEHEHEHRQELREADQPEIERIVRDVVDLPADGDALDLHGERPCRPGQDEGREARVAEGGPS